MRTDKKILTYNDLRRLRKKHKDKRIVLTMGSYDVFHLGHVIHLNFCKQQGDILVVGLGNDAVIRLLKGPTRPINPQTARVRLMASLELVDYAVLSEENEAFDVKEMANLLRPDIFVLPAGDSQRAAREPYMNSLGVNVVVCKRLPPSGLKGISSSQIVSRIRQGSADH